MSPDHVIVTTRKCTLMEYFFVVIWNVIILIDAPIESWSVVLDFFYAMGNGVCSFCEYKLNNLSLVYFNDATKFD